MKVYATHFFDQLKEFNINLDEESLDYIGGMLADLSLSTDINELRNSTEPFLEDANVDKNTIQSFYEQLKCSNDTTNLESISNNGKLSIKEPIIKGNEEEKKEKENVVQLSTVSSALIK